MYIQLGNQSVDWIEDRLGIKFDQKDRKFLESHHSENANVTDPMSWHAFELPASICLGSYKLSNIFTNMLKKYKCTGSLSATVLPYEYDAYVKNIIQLKDYPEYLFSRRYFRFNWGDFEETSDRYANDEKSPDISRFYKLIKVNRKTLVYREISNKGFFKDILHENNFELTLDDLLLPSDHFSDLLNNKIKIRKEELKTESPITVKDFSDNIIVTVWKGEDVRQLREYNDYKISEKRFEELNKAHRKELREIIKQGSI